jgi:trk system potassium uptake protein TrkA
MSRQQALIIGLGQFGMALAKALERHGTEVVAVDRRPERVQLAAAFATEAITMDATDEAEFARLRPSTKDICVCAIGEESREASIVVSAMLRQMGARRLIARATSEVHERILHLVGAHEVINPERILGERLAARFSYSGVLDVLPLGDDLVITELTPPAATLGRTLSQLQLPRNYQLTVLALRRSVDGKGKVLLPNAEMTVQSGDVLVVVGPEGATRRFAEEG